MDNMTKALTFRTELDRIETADIREFAKAAILMAPDSFFEDEELVTKTKKAFRIVEHLLSLENTKGALKDIILTGTLLADTLYNELEDRFKALHPVAARLYYQPVKESIHMAVWDGIFQIIESHENDSNTSPFLEAKAGTPGYFVSLAYSFLKPDFVQVSIDE